MHIYSQLVNDSGGRTKAMIRKKVLRTVLALTIVLTVATGICLVPTSAAAAAVSQSTATSASKCGQVHKNISALNVRSGPSTNYKVISKLSPASYVILLSKSGSFWKIEYAAGKIGYCSDVYVTVVSEKNAVFPGSKAANVMSGPGTSYKILAVLKSKTTVCILSTSGGWHKILFDGVKTGYVKTDYFQTYPNPAPANPKFVYPISYPNAKGGIVPYKTSKGRPFFEGHMAIDYNVRAANSNLDIFAIYPGKVVYVVTSYKKASKNGGCGNRVVIEHKLPSGKVFYSLYCHLSKSYVKVNQKVTSGQTIAKMGNTGNSTGTHLHISVFDKYSTGPKSSGGKLMDPCKAVLSGRTYYDVREVIRRQDLW